MKHASDYYRNLKGICKRRQLEMMYVFGSRAREIHLLVHGKGKPSISANSDVDIGVKPKRGVSLNVREKVQLGMELEDLFNVNRVDLLVISEVDPFVAANIVRGERIYCEDEYLADAYDLYILRRAGDLIHWERERMALIFHEGDKT